MRCALLRCCGLYSGPLPRCGHSCSQARGPPARRNSSSAGFHCLSCDCLVGVPDSQPGIIAESSTLTWSGPPPTPTSLSAQSFTPHPPLICAALSFASPNHASLCCCCDQPAACRRGPGPPHEWQGHQVRRGCTFRLLARCIVWAASATVCPARQRWAEEEGLASATPAAASPCSPVVLCVRCRPGRPC